jgi:hypothetical protein
LIEWFFLNITELTIKHKKIRKKYIGKYANKRIEVPSSREIQITLKLGTHGIQV